MRLQDFSFNKSQYERPNQKKICGWSIHGKPCQIGPDAKGNCQAQYECVPYKEGDRWLCTRPTNAGGKCESGPSATGECCNKTPRCVPIYSARAKRGKLIFRTVVFSVVLLVLILAGSWQSQFIDPGELSSKHHFDGVECAHCHVVDGDSTMQWVAAAFSTTDIRSKNAKCSACHQAGLNADKPHGLSLQQLAKHSGKTVAAEQDIVACASCHKEHRGAKNSLLSVADGKCDNCHQNSQLDFQHQHTAFTQYPYTRRTRLAFDHAAHIKDYFKKEKSKLLAPEKCSSCHELDIGKQNMLVKGFETACVNCHAKDTTGEKLDEKGIAMISLPALDLETLSSHNLHIGYWPADLEDEELSPLMILLLSSDKELQPVLGLIASGKLTLSDLSEQNKTTLLHVQRLVVAIKKFLFSVSVQGQDALVDVLKKSLHKSLGEIESSSLVAKLPAELIRSVLASWMPKLSKEMEIYNAGKVVRTTAIPTSAVENAELSAEDWVSHGGWYVQDFTLFYRPSGHNDALLKSLLELTAVPKNTHEVIKLKAFEYLSYEKRTGQCIKCHSIDEVDAQVTVNWKAKQYGQLAHQFNRFNHASHFSLLTEQGCLSCHQLNESADVMKSFKTRSPFVFESNWRAMEKSRCAQCHNEETGLDTCVLCHNYHVSQTQTRLPETGLLKADETQNRPRP